MNNIRLDKKQKMDMQTDNLKAKQKLKDNSHMFVIN